MEKKNDKTINITSNRFECPYCKKECGIGIDFSIQKPNGDPETMEIRTNTET